MQFLVNVLGMLTAALCASLLLLAYGRVRKRLLLWSGLCFAGLTLSNAVLILDLAILPSALASQADTLAQGLHASVTLGVGQFCTNPGVVLVPADAGFEAAVADALGAARPARLSLAEIQCATRESCSCRRASRSR